VLIKKYDYEHYDRETKKSGRAYLVGEKKLPSVTTILDKTKDKEWLKKWQEKVGIEEAERIKNEASLIGTEMHKYLEYYVEGKRYESLSPQGQQARLMALEIVKHGFKPITEVWGSEISLRHTDKYAGATDLVALYDGKPVIIDFKQSNKPAQEHYSKVQDYYTQLAAYGEAHSEHYGPIEGGVVLMCTRGLLFQKFEVFGDRYEKAKQDWWKKYDDYVAITKSEQLHQESEQKDETSTLETEQSSHQQSPQ
jgi:hypothetical protein